MNGPALNRSRRAMFIRGTAYFLLWMVMAGGDLGDVLPGIATAVLAAWASLVLMPPDPGTARVRPMALARIFARFIWGSIVAGIDVARRAFSPSMPLKLGYVSYPVGLPPSAARNLFMAVTSLMPGTLPTGSDESGALVYHCLDVDQPVIEQLEREEALLVAALGGAMGSAAAAAGEPRIPRGPT